MEYTEETFTALEPPHRIYFSSQVKLSWNLLVSPTGSQLQLVFLDLSFTTLVVFLRFWIGLKQNFQMLSAPVVRWDYMEEELLRRLTRWCGFTICLVSCCLCFFLGLVRFTSLVITKIIEWFVLSHLENFMDTCINVSILFLSCSLSALCFIMSRWGKSFV